ncbi:hypothetical protein mvi_54450 [Methylobacterium indicum]|uniref:Uncharacterized protein n=1 Tax=Methylobacterium indicum TaxID=1775910 RepID=A0A8H8WYW7_9HYPH|nr:hypothetical protein mvi_54450 [Methylobacterium indicum]
MIDWLIRPGAGSLRSGMSRVAVGGSSVNRAPRHGTPPTMCAICAARGGRGADVILGVDADTLTDADFSQSGHDPAGSAGAIEQALINRMTGRRHWAPASHVLHLKTPSQVPLPGAWPGQSPTRRDRVRISEEYSGRSVISV